MDRDQILRELTFLEARIADSQNQISRYHDKIKAHEDRGRPAEFEKSMLSTCEHALALHLSVREKLKQQLSRSTK
jgi:hypothetical protein